MRFDSAIGKSKEVRKMYEELAHACEREEMKLYRMARRAQAHGCSSALVHDIREEAHRLSWHNPEDLVNVFCYWKYAFC